VIETSDHHYLLSVGDRIVIGATREDAGFATHPTPRGMQDVLDHALAVAPDLSSALILEMRVGLRPITPDNLPLIGRLPGTSNGWICAGHGPLGLTLGPSTAAMLADEICERPADLPGHAYQPDRFGA
jgi:D-amino-acid dehydrogenase